MGKQTFTPGEVVHGSLLELHLNGRKVSRQVFECVDEAKAQIMALPANKYVINLKPWTSDQERTYVELLACRDCPSDKPFRLVRTGRLSFHWMVVE